MKKAFSSIFFVSLIVLSLISIVADSSFAQNININPKQGLPVIGISPGPEGTGAQQAQNLVSFIINAFALIGIIAALIYLIYGGIKWIISGGDKTAIDTARQHIIGAIIGLVIIVLAYVIINFVLFFLTGEGLRSNLPLPDPLKGPQTTTGTGGGSSSRCPSGTVMIPGNPNQCCDNNVPPNCQILR